MRPLFSARAFRISKISSCLRMPVAPGTSSCLAILVSAPTLMSLSVARSMRSIRSGCAGGCLVPVAAARRLVAAGVRQSVDQFPQFVQSFARDRRNRHHGIFKNGFEFRSARGSVDRARACRFSWRRRRPIRPPPSATAHACTSLSSPGCLASTRSTPVRRRTLARTVLPARKSSASSRRTRERRRLLPLRSHNRGDRPDRTEATCHVLPERCSPGGSCPGSRSFGRSVAARAR